jgi:hypothetical protein
VRHSRTCEPKALNHKPFFKYQFGVVGRPVTNIAMMAQAEGIHFWSFRNEQAASYAGTLPHHALVT